MADAPTYPNGLTQYAWHIDTDHIDTDAEGVRGPGGASLELLAELDRGRGFGFRIYDDDGEQCYSGRCISADLAIGRPVAVDSEHLTVPMCSGLGDEFLRPLEDFGAPNAGAVSIYYRCTDGRWGML